MPDFIALSQPGAKRQHIIGGRLLHRILNIHAHGGGRQRLQNGNDFPGAGDGGEPRSGSNGGLGAHGGGPGHAQAACINQHPSRRSLMGIQRPAGQQHVQRRGGIQLAIQLPFLPQQRIRARIQPDIRHLNASHAFPASGEIQPRLGSMEGDGHVRVHPAIPGGFAGASIHAAGNIHRDYRRAGETAGIGHHGLGQRIRCAPQAGAQQRVHKAVKGGGISAPGFFIRRHFPEISRFKAG